MSFVYGFIIPALENGKGKLRDFIMDEIFPVPQAEPFVIKFGSHADTMASAEGAVKEDAHGKASAVMGDRHEEGCVVLHKGGGLFHHLFPQVVSPVSPAVGGINHRQVGVNAPHRIAAVEGIIFPVVAGEEETPPFHGNKEPYGAGTVARASPFHCKARFQLQLRRRGVQDHGVPGLVVKLPVGLVGHEHRAVKALLYQIFDGASVVPVGVGNEKVLRLVNLLRHNVRNAVQPVGGGSRVYNKSVAVSLYVETVSSFIAASTCYKKLHISISIRACLRPAYLIEVRCNRCTAGCFLQIRTFVS